MFRRFPGSFEGWGRQRNPKYGAVAQLGERYNGIVEVVGSIPSGSTQNPLGNRRVCHFWQYPDLAALGLTL